MDPVASVNPEIVQVKAFGAAVLDALQIPGPPGPPAPPLNPAHVLAATHPKRFDPLGAIVLKNNSPVLQVAGSTVPVFSGRVEIAALKSTFRLWFRRSTWVWPQTIPASKHSGKSFTCTSTLPS